MTSMSSTMSTFHRVGAIEAKEMDGSEDAGACSGSTRFAMNVSLNVLPVPGALSTLMSPPMRRA